MNNLDGNSAQPCGCDKGENHVCDWHKTQPGVPRYQVGDPGPMEWAKTHNPLKLNLSGGGRDMEKAFIAADAPYLGVIDKPKHVNDPKIGLGGAPTRATTLPTDAADRKKHPVATGVLDYFPDALVAVARVSWQGNEQHNPGQPLHWARGKSFDEDDTIIRHFLQRGTMDNDGTRHSAKMVWRALAFLQKEIEEERNVQTPV